MSAPPAFLTESKSIEAGLEKAYQWKIPYLFVTMGGNGAFAVYNGTRVNVPGVQVYAIDTTVQVIHLELRFNIAFMKKGCQRNLPS
ncbi:fructokinase [Neobacillus vireti]|uniref:Fructokinase n=1 Tax=Neobacillus vireti LMG 21834 TaxID=1131730 RepID=A0AB94IPD5_9BACI|nr:fructokinase [Neobacillus vireti]ETI68946.1 fructokinase [Neobacillus vireti LMG 21834]KLT15752.1 hypothetical protein AA980_21245 [Neobacillus vireti]